MTIRRHESRAHERLGFASEHLRECAGRCNWRDHPCKTALRNCTIQHSGTLTLQQRRRACRCRGSPIIRWYVRPRRGGLTIRRRQHAQPRVRCRNHAQLPLLRRRLALRRCRPCRRWPLQPRRYALRRRHAFRSGASGHRAATVPDPYRDRSRQNETGLPLHHQDASLPGPHAKPKLVPQPNPHPSPSQPQLPS